MNFFNWLFSTQPEPKTVIRDNPIDNLSEEEKELLFEQKILEIIDDMEKDIPILFKKTKTKNYNINEHIDKNLFKPYWFTYNNQYDIAKFEIPFKYPKDSKFAIRLGKSHKYLYNEFEDFGYVKFNSNIHNKLKNFFEKLCNYHQELKNKRLLLKQQNEERKRQNIINDFIK